MWMIPVVLAMLVLVPAALFAACSAHDSAIGSPDPLRTGAGPDPDRRL